MTEQSDFRKLLEAAARLPWRITTCADYWIKHDEPLEPEDDDFSGIAHCGDIDWPNSDRRQETWEANARLIVAAVNALPEHLARIAELEAALKPFAHCADVKLCGKWEDRDSIQYTDLANLITFRDLRIARAALSGGKP
jgi:hypothetical protein